MKLRSTGLLIAIPLMVWLAPYILGGIFLVAITGYGAIEHCRYPTNAKFEAYRWQADQKFSIPRLEGGRFKNH